MAEQDMVGEHGASPDAVPFEPSLNPFETPESDKESAAQGDQENWDFWQNQIRTALVAERRWRKEALHAEKAYFGPDEDQGEGTSEEGVETNRITDYTATIHANIDVLKPLIFSETPQPIVQRRFKGDGKKTDQTDIMAAEAGQRLAQYILSTTPFDAHMEGIRDDWLIVGRGAGRALYKATFGQRPVMDPMTGQPLVDPATGRLATETVKLSEEVRAIRWEWRRFLCCPAHSWDRMPWVAFEVPMTRTSVKARFPEHIEHFSFNNKGMTGTSRGFSDDDRQGAGVTSAAPASGEPVPSPFDTATVWEVWNKDGREVIWFSPDCQGYILDKEQDPLQLEEFWPMPKPLLASVKGDSMNPRPDLRYYEDRAKEVDEASRKMRSILDVLAVAGVFPGSARDTVEKLLAGKNQLIPVTDWVALMDKGGTREMIQWLPLETMVTALNALNMMREVAKQAMFEASGVSDIMRAQGDPQETATAQNLKGKYAGMRLSARQRHMAIYVRDMLRIMVEIAVEMFDTAFIADVCGLDLPMTEAERQQIAMQAQAIEAQWMQQMQLYQTAQQAVQAMQQGDPNVPGAQQPPVQLPPPPPKPEIPDVPQTSWELVHDRLKHDISRKIAVNIETSSTILADEEADKAARVEFLQALSTFLQEIMPMVTTQVFPMKVAKELLLFGVRGFPKSRTLESMINELPDELPEPNPPPEDPQIQVAKIKAQVDLEIQEMKMADSALDRQAEMKMKGADLAGRAADLAARPVPHPQAPPPPKETAK
jgi:hypothetical protein